MSRTHARASRGIAVGIVLLLVPVASGAVAARPHASHHLETAAGGGIVARLSYLLSTAPAVSFTSVRLSVARQGKPLYDRSVPAPCAGCALEPLGGLGGGRHSLLVRDLDGDHEPEVLLELSTGGAGCCLYTYVYDFRATLQPTYRRTSERWAGGLRLRRLAGSAVPDFVTSDDRFDLAFTSNADSAEPIRIFEFRHGAFSDVTRRFSAEIHADALRQLHDYRSAEKSGADVRGILAAYVADRVLLDESARGWTVVRAALRRGQLRGNGSWPGGSAYVRRLCTFLVQTGYARDRSTCPST